MSNRRLILFVVIFWFIALASLLLVGLDKDRCLQINPKVSKNFRLSEFASPDTGEAKMDPRVIANLQAVRDYFDKEVIIISGYRTPAHNKSIGGHPESLHIKGMAVDWYVKGVSAKEMARVARECGFAGIGLYRYSVHTDIGEEETWYGKWRGVDNFWE